jgi:hypothetical protein
VIGPVANWGELLVETDVDEAVIATLKKWLPSYLTRLERERGLTVRTLARPVAASYVNTLEDDEFPDHQLPAIIVTTARTSEVERFGGGVHTVSFQVIVSSVVRGRTPPETRKLAALFSGCVRRVLVHQQDLGEFAQEVRFQRGNLAPLADQTDSGRWLAAGVNEFVVVVDDVLTGGVGPMQVDPVYDDPDPEGNPDEEYTDPVTVSRVVVSTTGVPITQEPGS